MRHGRNKQERETKLSLTRANNTPDHDTFEAELFNESGRKRGRPRGGLVGAHTARVTSSVRGSAADLELDEREPIGAGSAVAPTKRAERREAQRHQRERSLGHFAAGLGERKRASKRGKVSREALQRAGRAADEAMRRKPAKATAKATKKATPEASSRTTKASKDRKPAGKPTQPGVTRRRRAAPQSKGKTKASTPKRGRAR